MRFADVNKTAFADVAEVPRSEVRLLWSCGYWDGPVDGMAQLGGEQVWFCMEDDEGAGAARTQLYWLVRLRPDQKAAQVKIHEDFRAMVGTHRDYYEGTAAPPPLSEPSSSSFKRFYEKYDDATRGGPTDLEDNEVLGWFRW